MEKEKLLDVRGLKTYFFTEEGVIKSVDGVDFEVYPGETLGIVGESGCGKSVTSLSIMGLIPQPPGRIVDAKILFQGQDLMKFTDREMRRLRGNEISMIFQEPMTSLNPVYTIGFQISEAILLHKNISKNEAFEHASDMLGKVGIPEPQQRLQEYPHQLSGGLRQRAMIAMALSCNPQLLIADEPTTALDVTIQAQILALMKGLQEKFSMSIMLITHDLGVIAEMAERVVVMYAGKIVEYTDVETLFANPMHPYTWGLMNSIPRLDFEMERLSTIAGVVPNPLNFPKGCKYHTRCPLADEQCEHEEPDIIEIAPGHKVRCWYYEQLEALKHAVRHN